MKKTISKSMAWLVSVAMMFVLLMVACVASVEVKAANTAESLIAVAEGELGSTNYSKYYGGNKGAWCADFVSWCAQQAGVDSIALSSSCYYMYYGMLDNGCQEVSEPQRGDIVFFYCTSCSGTANQWCHVGIMVDSTTSIDGNYSGKVSYDSSYSHNGSLGYKHSGGITKKYVRPNYDGNNNFPGAEDTSYAVPYSEYATHRCDTYNGSGNKESGHYIAEGDYCYIDAVYENGFCHVEYDIPGDRRWAYAWAGDFNIPKKANKPSATNVGVSAGTNFTPTSFWWDASENVDHYDLKIWNGTYWEGDAYKIEWDIRNTSCSVQLPAGYYEAYVDAVNSEGCTMSNNVVRFTVEDGKIDLGTNFYAYIINTSAWKMAAVVDDNVQLESETARRNQLWYFERQDDLSYKISNAATGKCLDVNCSERTNGTNVLAFNNTDNDNQRWYFSNKDGNYVIHPKYALNMALDVNGASSDDGSNIQIWETNGTSAQTFTIWKFDNTPSKPDVTSERKVYSEGSDVKITWGENAFSTSYIVDVWYNNGVSGEHTENFETRNIEYTINNCKSGVYGIYITSVNPNGTAISDVYNFYVYKDIGNELYAYVVNSPSESYLINNNGNACFDKTSSTKESQKVWYFSKNNDGSYSIKSMNDSNMLDVDTSFDVKTYKLNTESINQQWFVFGEAPCYCIKPESTIDGVLDLNGGVYYDNVNAQIWARNNTDAQKFNIIIVAYTITYDMNGGKGSIESQNKTYGQKITISKATPSRSGYEFLGWSTNKKATSAQYSAGETFKTNGNTTLYAVWRANLKNTSTILSSAVQVGSNVTINAKATGGTGDYTYAVWYKRSSDSSWTTKQNYSTNATIKIKPASAEKYDISVKVKDSSGTIVKKAFTVNVFAPLKNTTTVSSTSIGYGGTFTVKAKATGGLGDYTYAVYYKKASATKWTTAQNYSSTKTVTIKPKYAEEYDVSVKVKDSRGVVAKKTFKIKVTKPTNTSKVASTTITLGNTIDITCSATGGSGFYQYAVYYKKSSDTSWKTKQSYSSNTNVSIKPASKTKYDVSVKVKDSLGNVSKQAFTITVK